MLGFNQYTIKKNERALLLRNGDFDGLYAAGKHRVFTGFDAVQLERFSLAEPAFDHELADYFLAREPELVQREFVLVSLGETEVGLRHVTEVFTAFGEKSLSAEQVAHGYPS